MDLKPITGTQEYTRIKRDALAKKCVKSKVLNGFLLTVTGKTSVSFEFNGYAVSCELVVWCSPLQQLL